MKLRSPRRCWLLLTFLKAGATNMVQLTRLAGEFYTCIPHRIGRSKAAMQEAVIKDLETFQEKQELIQLMKDMLRVSLPTEVCNELLTTGHCYH